ncbi:MAG: Crp/Fnr family transcriptional regulator [Actinomycetota bacterium]|nr:cyclic nucleotide-binding domain-containing protein [Actinomycetota bacterium]
MHNKDRYLEYFAKVPMFQALPKKDLAAVGKMAERVDVPGGTVLIKEGATGKEFFVVEKGTAVVKRGTKKLASLGAGGFFGELALLDGAPRDATVIAETDMTLVVLGQREFYGLLEQIPGLALKIMKGMAQRLRQADTKQVN